MGGVLAGPGDARPLLDPKLGARLLASRSPRARAAIALALCGALLALTLAVPLYETPFGREPTANLLGVLG